MARLNPRVRLVEDERFEDYQILPPPAEQNGGEPDILMRVRGIVGRADVPNKNKRVYPRSLWEKILAPDSPTMQLVRERGMYGELDHPPKDSDRLHVLLSEASHIVSELEMDDKGQVWGTFDVLDTDKGRNLAALYRAKGRVGASTRGDGSVNESEDGHFVVAEDSYVFETIDAVGKPSTEGAFPTQIRESQEGSDTMTLDDYKRAESEVGGLLGLLKEAKTPTARAALRAIREGLLGRITAGASTEGPAKVLCEGLVRRVQEETRSLVEDITPGADNDIVVLDIPKKTENGAQPNLPTLLTPTKTEEAAPPAEKKEEPSVAIETNKATESQVNPMIQGLLSEAAGAIRKGGSADRARVVAEQTFRRVEERLLRGSDKKSLREDTPASELVPNTYEPVEAPAKKDFPDEKLSIPEPPKELMDAEGDDEEKEKEEKIKGDKEMSESEKALAIACNRLLHENAKLRYENQIFEAVGRAQLARKPKAITEGSFKFRGRDIPFAKAELFCESLVKAFATKSLREGVTPGGGEPGDKNILPPGSVTTTGADIGTQLREAAEAAVLGARGAAAKKGPLTEGEAKEAAIAKGILAGLKPAGAAN